MKTLKKTYNIRVTGNPYVNLLAAIIEVAQYDSVMSSKEADRKDAEKGIKEWLREAEISVSMAGTDHYLHDREHGVRL